MSTNVVLTFTADISPITLKTITLKIVPFDVQQKFIICLFKAGIFENAVPYNSVDL